MFVSGAEQRRRERPDLYHKLLEGPQDPQLVELIKIGLLSLYLLHSSACTYAVTVIWSFPKFFWELGLLLLLVLQKI